MCRSLSSLVTNALLAASLRRSLFRAVRHSAASGIPQHRRRTGQLIQSTQLEFN